MTRDHVKKTYGIESLLAFNEDDHPRGDDRRFVENDEGETSKTTTSDKQAINTISDETVSVKRQQILERRYREVNISVPNEVFSRIGVAPGKVFADCLRLREKHPDIFPTPEDVKKHLAFVLGDPEWFMPATDKRFTLLTRQQGNHNVAIVEFVLRGGKYRVRSAYTMGNEQLAKKKKASGLFS